MNLPGNRSSLPRPLSVGRGNLNSPDRNSLLLTRMDDEGANGMDLAAFFAPPPTRWEQSEGILDYFYLLYVDTVEWWEEFDWEVLKDYIIYFFERFSLSITVRINFFYFHPLNFVLNRLSF